MIYSPIRARPVGLLALLLVLGASGAPGQAVAPAQTLVQTPEEARVLQALAADSRTSPFLYATSVRDGRVVLSGRVGSASHHAAAMEVALATGVPITDRLVIDTAELARVPRQVVVPQAVVVPVPPPLYMGTWDPLFGFEPPLITYPPWWPAMSARRLAENEAGVAPAAVPNAPPAADPSPIAPPATSPRPVPPPPAPGNVDGNAVPAPPRPQGVQTTLTSRVLAAIHAQPGLAIRDITVTNRGGQIRLSGEVASVREAFDAFQAARAVPGVEGVTDELRYPVPPPDGPNPLLAANPADGVAAFLRGHVARQLGDAATLRALGVQGNQVRITVDRTPERDPSQVGALLRSMPLLRGFVLTLDQAGGAVEVK